MCGTSSRRCCCAMKRASRRPDVTQIVVTVVVVAGLVGLTVWQAGSLRIGSVVAAGFAATAIVLHLAGTLLLRAIKPLARSRSFALRHAVLQLSRPGSQMRIVLLAVGLGSFFIIGVRSLQENLVDQFAVRMTADSPDMFLLDIQRDQVDGGRSGDCRAHRSRHDGAAARAGVARPRRRRRRARAQSRELRGRARPRLARPRIHDHLSSTSSQSNERIVAGQMWEPTAVGRARSVDRAVHQRVVQDQHRRYGSLRRPRPGHRRQGHQRALRRVVGEPHRRIHVPVPARRAREGAAQLHRFPARAEGPRRRAPGCRPRSSASRRTCR